MKKVIAVLVVLVILGVAVFLFLKFFGGFGFGNGNGNGSGEASGSSSADISSSVVEQVTEEATKQSTAEQSVVRIVIEVKDSDIYYDGVLCNDVTELEEFIISDENRPDEYEFRYGKAIEATYDEVKEVLCRLSDSLGITVLYSDSYSE